MPQDPRCLIKEVMGMIDAKTSIQISPGTRDRLYRLKFRRTYDQFLNELCDMYEREGASKE